MIEKNLKDRVNRRIHKNDTMPHNKIKNYSKEFVGKRCEWLEEKTACSLRHIRVYSEEEKNMQGNIENLIGVCQIPVGIAGPLKINGDHAKGDFYVPLATTEGALVMTYHRGMKALSRAGGVSVRVLRDEMHISPAFYVKDLADAENLIKWIKANFHEIKKEAESTTQYGKLLDIEPIIISREVITRFTYYTADAQGLNMINRACEKACRFIERETGREYVLRSNYSSIKKSSNNILHIGQGKSVFADATLTRDSLRILGVTPREIERYFRNGELASRRAGMLGNNAHFANAIAALFIACGQDAADVSISHVGVSSCEAINDGNELYISVYLPNLSVGTVGGGTGLGTQKECLEILDCYGAGKAKKFAEIVGATVLAGEIAALAALAARIYVRAHEKYGRNRPEHRA
ncbi:MAG: hydroxymethylglutaryl-CoA reductase [Candidatus Makaraimicrobium thalassicum]|nr:MAG: hydroxymethylglutaryl-CoA reductase [Candidatus Omnitrophota bacterium]